MHPTRPKQPGSRNTPGARAAEYLDAVLASDEFTSFEKVMLESRFYRGVGFVPFMKGSRDGTIADMARAEAVRGGG